LSLLQKRGRHIQVNNRQTYSRYVKTLKNLNQTAKELKIHAEIPI
jgi:hypothetical protein